MQSRLKQPDRSLCLPGVFGQLVAIAVSFSGETSLFCPRVDTWAYGQLLVGAPPSFNGIFLSQSRRAAFCLPEGVALREVFEKWHVIGRPGILVPGSSQAFGCPSHLSPSPLWILHTA